MGRHHQGRRHRGSISWIRYADVGRLRACQRTEAVFAFSRDIIANVGVMLSMATAVKSEINIGSLLEINTCDRII